MAIRLLESLPCPAFIGKLAGNRLKIVASNPLCEEDAIGLHGHGGFDRSLLVQLGHAAQRAATNKASMRWTAPGELNHVEFDITAALLDESDDASFLYTLIDRSTECETRQNLRKEMVTDSLTGLPNRAGFEEAVDEAIANAMEKAEKGRAAPPSFAMILVDLVRFSQINECAGSIVGDEFIISVAARLRGKVRKMDLVGRTGGDEFAVFVELRRDGSDLDRLIGRIRSVFSDPFCLSDLEIQADAAIGLAVGTIGRSDPTECIRHAQIALKKAKKTAQLEAYSPEALDNARRRFSVETRLRKAIEARELELNYQPLIDLSSNRVMGFEALARWNDSERGPISPVEFIPVAEESGLIVPLGRWALEEACQALKRWDAVLGHEAPVRMNVNISAIQFAREDLPKLVSHTLRTTHVNPERVALELTESVVVSDPRRARAVMQDLRDLDIHLAIDDFGTGYSNLASLQQLPIDVLKIDRSFVSRMLEDRNKVAIIRAILSLATALEMETTAEGIESLQLCNTLSALGCTFGQGYYFAAPLSEQEAIDFYQRYSDGYS